MPKRYHFPRLQRPKILPNLWDVMLFLLVASLIGALGYGASRMVSAYEVGSHIHIHLSADYLPLYAIRSVIRMFIALIFSILASLIIGTLAAKNRHAERFIVPLIDVLQSVPILGYLSITAVGFIALFHGSMLGPECAAIFAIFTSQAWNMILSIYQSLKTVPQDLMEAGYMLQLTAWQRFWRIEIPFAMPSFLWNTMMSLSAGWFFVVASEAIPLAKGQIMLPGIGSYIAVAITEKNELAIFYAIITMFTVILVYDQILFRPLIKWSEKFNMEITDSENATSTPWVLRFMLRAKLLQKCGDFLTYLFSKFINLNLVKIKKNKKHNGGNSSFNQYLVYFFYTLAIVIILMGSYSLVNFILTHLGVKEIFKVFYLACLTTLRVFILIFLCALLWVPVGVWVGLRPQVAAWVQPVAQFLAAFPANLLFPPIVSAIVIFKLNPNIYTAPLMILGTQWYLLFNVIVGARSIPPDLVQAAQNMGVKGWLWWEKVAIPAIFPYFITGALTAAGGAWNASIIAEYASWGDTTIKASGLGTYIREYTFASDFPRIALGITVMCLFVIVINRLFWQPLYRWAEIRFKLM